MIAPDFNIPESLGALIGVGVAPPAADVPDFAALLSSVTPEPVAVQPPASTAPEIPAPAAPSVTAALPKGVIEPALENAPASLMVAMPKLVTPEALNAAPSVAPPASDPMPISSDKSTIAEPFKFPPDATKEVPAHDQMPERVEAASEDIAIDAPALADVVQQILISVDAPLTATSEFKMAPEISTLAKRQMVERHEEAAAPQVVDTQIAIAAPMLLEPAKRTASRTFEKLELSVAPAMDQRPMAVLPTLEKPAPPLPERVATFEPIIADAVRDLIAIARDKDVRFSVRPEILGPIAVSIERSDAGPILRLGVDTQAAVQAVRQAEPMMNDARGNAPFVQVTVDMSAPDGGARTPRSLPQSRAKRDQKLEQTPQMQPALAGRYA
jgi:hypothetical protein